MGENKFIKHLKGEDTAKSVLEIKNQRTTTSFANMPDGDTSNANDVYSDHRGNATGVLKGAENWKLDGQNLVETTTVYGDGRDFTDSFSVFGNGLWVDATCTFATARRFSPNTKFVLKLCGHDLETVINHTVDFTLIVKFGVSNLISKTFTVTEQAFDFCKEFVIDFAESNSSTIKADAGSTMQVQLLCADPAAAAVLYNGMTVFTALQRRVDGDVVASNTKTFPEIEQDIDDINDEIDKINKDIDDLEEHVDKTFVLKSGDTMSGALNIADIASSNTPLVTLTHSNTTTYKWNIAPRYNSTTLSVYPGSTETNGFRFATTGFVPASNNARYLGSASLKWKGVYTGALNNGADLVVPNKAGTLATMDDVELAARSGTQLTDQGVWYAKMYAATVAPAAENGTNYADFSQVDGKGNPIIVTYNRVNGAWVQDQTITPPAEYDGYVIVTSKIWDIAEQTGQQGGRVLWNHTSKEFTPYPQIISFEDIEVTGDSTVIMPQNPGANQIVNKDYVDDAIAAIPTPTVDVTQSIDAEIYGSVTVSGNDISNFSTGDYVRIPGVFQFKDASSFEIVGAFTTNANSGSQMILCPTNGWLVYMMSGIRIMNSLTDGQQLLHVTIWPDKTTTLTSQSFRGTTNLAANTKYYIKLTYDGTDYKLYLSTDGVNYALEASDTATYLPETNANGYYLGPRPDSTGTMIAILHMDTWSIKKDTVTVWAGVDAPGLHQRAESSHEVIAFQSPTAGNNYTWYRKYADGWVEQGGYATTSGNTGAQITLPVTMLDAHYLINGTCDNDVTGGVFHFMIYENQTTTGFAASPAYAGEWRTGAFYWEVRGMAA